MTVAERSGQSVTCDGNDRHKRAVNPSNVTQRALAKRLKVTAEALPAGWIAGRLPRPALPIDECVSGLVLKRRIRSPADLRALHPLAVCPYALARSECCVQRPKQGFRNR